MTASAATMSPLAERYAEECLKLSAETASYVRVLRDVSYGTDQRQRLDIYLPPQTGPSRPAVTAVHTRRRLDTRHQKLVRIHGATGRAAVGHLCLGGYRLIPTVSFPAPVICIAALRAIAEHIAEHGGIAADCSLVGIQPVVRAPH